MIPEEQLAEIRARTDIVGLVSEHVELKRSGRSFKGLCPFHSERSPSFYVHPERGFFHCFGCQASGDVISFLMQADGASFPEAAQRLAERAGIELAPGDAESDRAARRARAHRERLQSIIDASAGFFVRMLDGHRFSAMARAELESRGITEATAKAYRLGYAPHGWDGLATFLAEKGVSPADAEEVGVLVPRRSRDGHYDRFRHRLMCPISDVQGRIIAFSGRALPSPPGNEEPEPPAKYVNSPEGPLYKKGDVLFGLHEARVALRRSDEALLCEGNFDVLALAQAGFENTVAPLGTAFTVAQARLLRRFVAKVYVLFDGDSAGQKAVRAAQPLLAEAGVSARVVTLPPGEDPDSFLRAQGKDALQVRLDSAPGIVEHLIESAAGEAGDDAALRAQAIEALGPVVAAVGSPVEARLYVERVARAFGVQDIEAVRQQLRRGARAARGRPPGRTAEAPVVPAQAPRGVEAPKIERDLVGAFLDQPSLHESDLAGKVRALLTNPDLRAIFSISARWVGARGVDAHALLEELRDSPARTWLEKRLAVQDFQEAASAREFIERATEQLGRKRAKHERDELARQARDARRVGDHERAEALMRRVQEAFQKAARGATEGT